MTPPTIPSKIDLHAIADPENLWQVADLWYKEWKCNGDQPGSEWWQTMYANHLMADIKYRWSIITGYPVECFPWVQDFVLMITTKRRKQTKEQAEKTNEKDLFSR